MRIYILGGVLLFSLLVIFGFVFYFYKKKHPEGFLPLVLGAFLPLIAVLFIATIYQSQDNVIYESVEELANARYGKRALTILPGDHSYLVVYRSQSGSYGYSFVLPADNGFILGDERDEEDDETSFVAPYTLLYIGHKECVDQYVMLHGVSEGISPQIYSDDSFEWYMVENTVFPAQSGDRELMIAFAYLPPDASSYDVTIKDSEGETVFLLCPPQVSETVQGDVIGAVGGKASSLVVYLDRDSGAPNYVLAERVDGEERVYSGKVRYEGTIDRYAIKIIEGEGEDFYLLISGVVIEDIVGEIGPVTIEDTANSSFEIFKKSELTKDGHILTRIVAFSPLGNQEEDVYAITITDNFGAHRELYRD